MTHASAGLPSTGRRLRLFWKKTGIGKVVFGNGPTSAPFAPHKQDGNDSIGGCTILTTSMENQIPATINPPTLCCTRLDSTLSQAVLQKLCSQRTPSWYSKHPSSSRAWMTYLLFVLLQLPSHWKMVLWDMRLSYQ